MENFLHLLIGQHALDVWGAGLIWSIIGMIAVKLRFLPNDLTWNSFKFFYWLNDNAIDFIKGIWWSLVALRLGDILIHLIEKYTEFVLPETTDFVIIMILVSGLIQYKLHKNRKPISEKVAQEMHIHNKNCNHD